MENIVGSLGERHEAHATKSKYLNDDPHYPCTIVGDRYKWTCYFFQTSRMMQLFSGDFAKISVSCAQAPTPYQRVCFESMGRDVSGRYRGDPAGAIQACSFATPSAFRTACLSGAVQDTFWEPAGKNNAINFCKHLEDSIEKDACYSTIFARALEIFSSNEDVKFFCLTAEAEYQLACLDLVR